MSLSSHKTEGVNRVKTVRFYPFVSTGNGASSRGTRRTDNARDQLETGRFLFWTEDCCGPRPCGANRMHTAVDDKYYSYYVYDHSGRSCASREQSQACLSYAEMEQRRRSQRRLKLVGDNCSMDVNAEYMNASSALNEPTLYPSAYMVLTNKGYTKHYYAGTERVAARLGGGGLDVIGNDEELQTKADMLFKQSLEQVNNRVLHENDLDCIMGSEFAKEEFGHWIDGIPNQMQAGVELDHSQLKDMVHSMLDDLNHGQEKEVYFYHSDHLGSASWITDFEGIAVQHLQYMPYGEPYIDQRAAGTTYSERFRFTGKERDEETGYGYFGARYMDHELMSMWLSVDPMADKYPSISPYAYCAWNPVKLVDPDGREIGDYYDTKGNYLGWDGKQDMNVYIVKNQKSINKIISNTNNKKTTSSSNVNIAVSTNYAVMQKACEVLDITHQRKGQKEFGISMKGITFSSMQEGTFGGCTIYPVDDGFSGEGASIHSHPDADDKIGHWITNPSQVDIDETFCNYDLNIIVGQCERRDMSREIQNAKYGIQYGAAFYGRPSAGMPKEDVKPNVVILENALRNIACGQVSAVCSRLKVK